MAFERADQRTSGRGKTRVQRLGRLSAECGGDAGSYLSGSPPGFLITRRPTVPVLDLEPTERIGERMLLKPFLARSGIPKLDRPVIRARGQGLSIRTPSYGVHTASVSPQAGQLLARQ